MVKLNKIYTRTGDDGTTGLVGGTRIAKSHPRISAIGAVDETSSAMGVALSQLDPLFADMRLCLTRIQNDLFDLGADLSNPKNAEPQSSDLRILQAQVDWLEGQIDATNAPLPALTSFVLPGGSPAAAHLHLARAICRRAETQAIALAGMDGETVSKPVRHYLNRLSDFLFVASRSINHAEACETLWVPGENR